MKRFFLPFYTLSFALLGLSSCISRLNRPAITGYIYDYDNRPIQGCKVGETYTDNNGKFYLKEQRTNRFLLTEMLSMEAPPVFFVLDIEKEGFHSYSKDFFQRHGGGRRKGALDNLDTIYMKRIDETIIADEYLYTNWDIIANKNLDTLYGVNSNYRPQRTMTNNTYFDQQLSWGLIHRFQNTTPPDSSWSPESYDLKTSYSLDLRRDGSYQGYKTLQYLNPWRHRMEYGRTYRESYSIPTDSSQLKGTFNLSATTIYFDKSFAQGNRSYKIDSIDRDIIILTEIR